MFQRLVDERVLVEIRHGQPDGELGRGQRHDGGRDRLSRVVRMAAHPASFYRSPSLKIGTLMRRTGEVKGACGWRPGKSCETTAERRRRGCLKDYTSIDIKDDSIFPVGRIRLKLNDRDRVEHLPKPPLFGAKRMKEWLPSSINVCRLIGKNSSGARPANRKSCKQNYIYIFNANSRNYFSRRGAACFRRFFLGSTS